jgi:hypothetical protein
MTRGHAGAAAALVLVLALSSRAAHACAGCSNPNLPSARSESSALPPGDLTVAVSLTALTTRVVHPESCPEIGPICAQRDEPGQQHDQRFYIAELRPVLAVGVLDQLAVELQLPLRAVNSNITFRRLDGAAFEPDYQNIHHRDETLYGIADPWLLARSTLALGALALTGRAGLGLPLGSTEEDPFARARAGLSHQHIQFGSGTFHPVLALDAELPLGIARLSLYGQSVLFLYENSHGYRPGHRFLVGTSADVELLAGLRAGAGVDLLNEQAERWDGEVQQDGNVGRTDLLLGGSVSYRLDPVALSLSVKAPVYQYMHEHDGAPGQLTYPAIVAVAAQTRF